MKRFVLSLFKLSDRSVVQSTLFSKACHLLLPDEVTPECKDKRRRRWFFVTTVVIVCEIAYRAAGWAYWNSQVGNVADGRAGHGGRTERDNKEGPYARMGTLQAKQKDKTEIGNLPRSYRPNGTRRRHPRESA